MAVTFWNTMAVGNLEVSSRFYEAIGFKIRPMPGGAGVVVCPDASSMVCLFPQATFRSMIPGEICDSKHAQEIIQSVTATRREDVDALIARAAAAGGGSLGNAREEPFGYVGGFADPDGHVWSVLWFSQPAG
ncbi:MAG: hypothetical protein IT347_12910 [Candidatus Eisenbacteria bacterium]|nr:hypothetical protein [Candidatus Eisenbacteria bacterium]